MYNTKNDEHIYDLSDNSLFLGNGTKGARVRLEISGTAYITKFIYLGSLGLLRLTSANFNQTTLYIVCNYQMTDIVTE